MLTQADLTAELANFCAGQRIKPADAYELIHEEISPAQRAWISDFIERWEQMEEARA